MFLVPLTRVLKIHVITIKGVFQAIRNDLQLHDLLPYRHVRLGDVNVHLRIIDLIGQTISHELGEVPVKTESITHILLACYNYNGIHLHTYVVYVRKVTPCRLCLLCDCCVPT